MRGVVFTAASRKNVFGNTCSWRGRVCRALYRRGKDVAPPELFNSAKSVARHGFPGGKILPRLQKRLFRGLIWRRRVCSHCFPNCGISRDRRRKQSESGSLSRRSIRGQNRQKRTTIVMRARTLTPGLKEDTVDSAFVDYLVWTFFIQRAGHVSTTPVSFPLNSLSLKLLQLPCSSAQSCNYPDFLGLFVYEARMVSTA